MENMYKQRQTQLIAHLQQENMDIALVMSPTNIYYYTGFNANPHERFMMFAIEVDEAKTSLYLPSLDEQAASDVALVDTIIPVSDIEDGYKVMARKLGNAVESIAFEKNYFTVAKYEQLISHYREVKYVNIEGFILEARKQKTESEINHVRKAIEITEKGLEIVSKQIKVGMTELEVKALLEYELTVLGAEGLAFDTTVLTGENSALPHGSSGNRKIVAGEFLLIDFGIYLNGYCSDITRTFVIGDASEEQISIYETVLAANEQAIAAVKLNAPLKNIDIAAREVIEAKGYGEYFTHRVGHGMGLEVHEYPSIHSENNDSIEAGLLFTIEPGIYIPGLGGVRIEDDINIDASGKVEVLTSFPKKLNYLK